MVLRLSSTHLQALRNHAEQAYPHECCGLLLGIKGASETQVMTVWATENAWTPTVEEHLAGLQATDMKHPHSQRDRYWIDPKDLLEAQRYARDRHLNVIGVYHSHPDHAAVPSECDRSLAWAEYSYVILSVVRGCTQDLLCWCLDENHQFQSEPLVVSPSALPE